MKLLLSLAIAFLGGSAFFTVTPLQVGSTLPMATQAMTGLDGKPVTFNDLKTLNGLLVMFSSNSCPYVIKNQQRTRDILKYAQSKNLGIAVVNSNEATRDRSESPEDMKRYATEQQYNWPYTIDKNHEIADAFGATKTPEIFLFDKNDKLVYHGAIDDSPADETAVQRQHLHIAIDEMLSGKPVTVTTSRSVGCAIKRLK